jgi:GTP-binding protein LepA
MSKLQLNDSAFVFQPESSVALGFGFRCGFLGLLHMEIIQERLRREYNMDIIATYPSVVYQVVKTNGEHIEIDNPANLPDMSVVEEIREPIVKCFVMVPNENIGDMMQLMLDKRGTVEHTESLDSRRVSDQRHSSAQRDSRRLPRQDQNAHSRYGSMDYEPSGYREADLVKLEMLVNGEPCRRVFFNRPSREGRARGRSLAAKLRGHPAQLYQVAIQAAIGGKVIARENVTGLRKNVTAKCTVILRESENYWKSKRRKERMKAIGSVNIPRKRSSRCCGRAGWQIAAVGAINFRWTW